MSRPDRDRFRSRTEWASASGPVVRAFGRLVDIVSTYQHPGMGHGVWSMEHGV